MVKITIGKGAWVFVLIFLCCHVTHLRHLCEVWQVPGQIKGHGQDHVASGENEVDGCQREFHL